MFTSALQERLNELGWTSTDLARECCKKNGIDPVRSNIIKWQVYVSRAINNPEKMEECRRI
jgi:hypothetical protein